MKDPQNKLEQIIEIVSVLNHETAFVEMLRLISLKTLQIFDSDFVTITVLNPQTHNTIKTVLRDEKLSDPETLHRVNINISGWVLTNRTVFLSNDLPNDKRFSKGLLANTGIKSAIGVLLIANDKPIGVILLMNQAPHKLFTEDDSALAEKLAAVISPFINRTDKLHQYFSCSLPDDELIIKYSKFGLFGRGSRFIDMLKSIESAAKCDVRVLLEGETGTGKEVISKAIHRASYRADKKFVVIDCGAIQDSIIESELFGHIKGSFTGALKDRMGILEEANGGTLFIDEINCLPMDTQMKFLRFLQEKEFKAVGSNEVKKSDVRVIAASSASLNKLVKEKKIREELFYRLNVYPICIPSLNDRIEDIPILANHFISIFAAKQKKNVETFDSEVLELLIQRRWGGNIRELENFIERMITLCPDNENILSKNYLPTEYLNELKNLRASGTIKQSSLSLPAALAELEIQMIRESLVRNNWNQTKAAEALQIPEQTLRYKMQKLHIKKSEE